MKVDHETLQKIAHLARLEVRPDEEAELLNRPERGTDLDGATQRGGHNGR